VNFLFYCRSCLDFFLPSFLAWFLACFLQFQVQTSRASLSQVLFWFLIWFLAEQLLAFATRRVFLHVIRVSDSDST
jgi:uncharacterized membrane protein YqgA involved in biofilm formation